MPKMRERCATRSTSRRPRRAGLLVALALASSPTVAHAAARRIAILRAEPALARSVDLALYPWDIAVVEAGDAPPDPAAPDASSAARAIAERVAADVVAWVDRSAGATTLWFFDRTDGSLRARPSRGGRTGSTDDPAELAAIALTLKTLVRASPWEQSLPIVPRAAEARRWESRAELGVVFRTAASGTTSEPRVGLWVSEWYAPARRAQWARWKWGAALGASNGLGMTFANANAYGTLEDLDLRAALRARWEILAGRAFLEPALGASAHVERAEITTTTAGVAQSFTRVDPSLDAGHSLGWQVSGAFAWSLGIEALAALRYQRWLEGSEVVFAPAPVWIQGGTAIAWSFR